MKLFDDILLEEESLFRNEGVLDFDYLPEMLPHRLEEKRWIANCIKPLFGHRNGTNMFIYGAPGIGKTATVRSVFRELGEYTSKVMPIYINCWEDSTTYSVMSRIAERLGVRFRRGERLNEIMALTRSRMDEVGGIAVAFDEVDKPCEHYFLYKTLSLGKSSVFLITNKKEFMAYLDPRIRGRLTPETLEFKPYSHEETERILDERRFTAFVPRCWDKDAFELVVEEAFKLKDIRSGLFLLLESGRVAEIVEASRRIEKRYVEKAKKNLAGFNIRGSPDLRDDDKLILELVKENPGITSGKLYELFQQKGGRMAKSSFRRYFKKLIDQKLIRREFTSKGFRGRSSKFFYVGGF